MDAGSLVFLAISFAGAKITHKFMDEAIDRLWSMASATFDELFQKGQLVSLTQSDAIAIAKVNPSLLNEAKQFLGNSPALRRAQHSADALKGTRILWVDDHPENNAWERRAFDSLGVEIVTVERTKSAVASLSEASSSGRSFDLIISDIARDSGDENGIRALPRLKSVAADTPIVLYVGTVKGTGTPPGVFGITNDPEELFHFVLDVVGRIR